MRSVSTVIASAALLAKAAIAQDTYCDELSRCYSSYTTSNGVTFGIAVPEVDVAPYDIILQVTAPIELGWVGFSWGGGMSYNPLAVTWANGDSVVISSRIAFGYALPDPYADATYTLLDGSYANETHFVTTALCSGCSAWDAGTGPRELDPAGSNVVAFASSTTPVDDPSDPNTGFAQHASFSIWGQDFSIGRSASFDEWAGVAKRRSTAAPRVVAPRAAPSSCGLQSRFPLQTAEGWSFVKIKGGLNKPRGLVVDSLGNLISVEQGKGVSVHTFDEEGCISSSKTLISNTALNHGIALTPDGNTLVVSSPVSAWRYDYDAEAQTVSNQVLVVTGMEPGGHTTRTAVIPPDTPDLLILSVGSRGNLDWNSINKAEGRATLKVFNLTSAPSGGYDYRTSGWFLGYGLRNEVAVVVDKNNMVWGVENSADEFTRTVDGVTTVITEENPAEELNFLGDPSISNENWYGYPTCFTVWGGEQFPDGNPTAGAQFIPAPNSTWTDARCEEESRPPRLALQAHTAPIDGKFDEANENLYVSLHGSWNRKVPAGYKVVQVPFTQGGDGLYEPVADAHSDQGYNDIVWDTQQGCTSSKCFRPSGIVWDKGYTRMFVGSDNPGEGELYILFKN